MELMEDEAGQESSEEVYNSKRSTKSAKKNVKKKKDLF